MEDELFLSTPSARRATAVGLAHPQPRILISIHALREEGDGDVRAGLFCSYDFYPRPPRGGRRSEHIEKTETITISIHALREEGDLYELDGFTEYTISIHALREEGDVF